MKALWFLIRFSGFRFYVSAIFSVFSGFCGTLSIQLINEGIHRGILDPQIYFLKVITFLTLFTVCALFGTWMLQTVIQELLEFISFDLSEKIIKSPFEFTENKKERLFTVLTYDVYTLSGIIEKIPNFIIALSIVGGCTIYILLLSQFAAGILIFIFALVVLITLLTNRKLAILSNKGRLLYDDYASKVYSLIYGTRELKQNSIHANFFLNMELRETLEKKKKNSLLERVFIQFSDKLTESAALLGISIGVISTSYFVGNDKVKFAEIFTLSLFIIGPLSTVASFIKNLKPFDSSLKNTQSLGLELERTLEVSHPIKKEKSIQTIELKNIKFKYSSEDESSFSIGPISLKLQKERICILTGGNGSGKSTLIKVLAGLYSHSAGEIFIDEDKLEKVEQSYRDLFSVIHSDHFLFQSIGYVTFDEITADFWLKTLQLSEKTSLKDGTYSNIRLSQGQQKRVALISSILEDKPVYVFDEWAANQDYEFKVYFYRNFLPELRSRGKIILVVSHDKEFFDVADTIYHMQNGII